MPASENYPGIVKRRIPGTDRCIEALGWGPAAELAVEEALARHLHEKDQVLKEDLTDG